MKENERTYDIPAGVRTGCAKKQTELFVDQLADADDKLHSFSNIAQSLTDVKS